MSKINLVQLNKALSKVDYPISRRDLIKYAEDKGIDEKVLRLFTQLPSQRYQTSDEALSAIFSSQRKRRIKINREQVEKILQDVVYPISKPKLVLYAENKGVDEKILKLFIELPPRVYDTSAQILEAIEEH
ncbi:DUF2795 domain-containing protein [Gloeothece verrucosa]|uniref:DUF2795 domain-containing protein n=1 Tax=Gloeothece verrucosa (strain PCC 7822) TaxID=497965 RepID=E0U5F7_GLOV7|nr:DUF2795 domain-containing protein [Gloeothece verrucosa]ADN13547.1 conserved hypothetical protein [Gloeothece verrucosa PCC 7822]